MKPDLASRATVKTSGRGIVQRRKPYVAPRLVCYGSVRRMTQTGATAMASESGSGGYCNDTYKFHMACSDRRAKQGIRRVGCHPLGIGLYLFEYKPEFRDKWGHGRQFGVMADEVYVVCPRALFKLENDFWGVDYSVLGVTRHL